MDKSELEKYFTKRGLLKIVKKFDLSFSFEMKKSQLIDVLINNLTEAELESILVVKVRNRNRNIWSLFLSGLTIVGLILGIWADGNFAISKLFKFEKKQVIHNGNYQFSISDSLVFKILILDLDEGDSCSIGHTIIEDKIYDYIRKALSDKLLFDFKITFIGEREELISRREIYHIGANSLSNLIISGAILNGCGKSNSDSIDLRFFPLFPNFVMNINGLDIEFDRTDITSQELEIFNTSENKLYDGFRLGLKSFNNGKSRFTVAEMELLIYDYFSNYGEYLNVRYLFNIGKFEEALWRSDMVDFFDEEYHVDLKNAINGEILRTTENLFESNYLITQLIEKDSISKFPIYLKLLEKSITRGDTIEYDFYRVKILEHFPCHFIYEDLIAELKSIDMTKSKLRDDYFNERILKCLAPDSISYYLLLYNYFDIFNVENNYNKLNNLVTEFIDVMMSNCVEECINLGALGCIRCLDNYVLNIKHLNDDIQEQRYMAEIYYLYGTAKFELGEEIEGIKFYNLAFKNGYKYMTDEEIEKLNLLH